MWISCQINALQISDDLTLTLVHSFSRSQILRHELEICQMIKALVEKAALKMLLKEKEKHSKLNELVYEDLKIRLNRTLILKKESYSLH